MHVAEISSAGFKPVTVAQMQEHLNIDLLDSDEATRTADLIEGYLDGAIDMFEQTTGHYLAKRDFRLTFSEFPVSRNNLHLDIYPLSEVKSISYIEESGVTQSLDLSILFVDEKSNPAKLVLKENEDWPDTQEYNPKAVTITVAAGYGEGNIPKRIKNTIKMLCAHFFENREALHKANTITEIPLPAGVKHLIAMDRVKNFAS